MKKWVFITLLFGLFNGYGQEKTDRYEQEFRLVVDNDVFTSLYRDQYYSSGLFGYYRHLKKEDSVKRIIRSYSLNQRIFTPENLTWRFQQQLDRPYAGHISVFASNEYYYKSNLYIMAKIELGWMGPGSLTGSIQETWHTWFGLPYPEGWQFQIQNSPIINFYGTLAKTLLKAEGFDMTTESNIALGTAFTHVRQELLFRLGKIKNINESVNYNGQLGSMKRKKETEKGKLVEGYFLYAPGFEYNINNTTIEGNLIGKESPHTEIPIREIIQHKVGLMLGWPAFDIQFTYYFRSKETTEALPHRYVGLHLNQRF